MFLPFTAVGLGLGSTSLGPNACSPAILHCILGLSILFYHMLEDATMPGLPATACHLYLGFSSTIHNSFCPAGDTWAPPLGDASLPFRLSAIHRGAGMPTLREEDWVYRGIFLGYRAALCCLCRLPGTDFQILYTRRYVYARTRLRLGLLPAVPFLNNNSAISVSHCDSALPAWHRLPGCSLPGSPAVP